MASQEYHHPLMPEITYTLEELIQWLAVQLADGCYTNIGRFRVEALLRELQRLRKLLQPVVPPLDATKALESAGINVNA